MPLKMSRRLAAQLAASLGLIVIPAQLAIAQSDTESPTTKVESAPAESADDKPLIEDEKDPWRAEFIAWIWLMGVQGDVGVRGKVAHVSAGFKDILDNSDSLFALSGRLEVAYGKLGFYVDGIYADISANQSTGLDEIPNIDVRYQQTTIDFGLMYRIGEWEPFGGPSKNPRKMSLDAYGGARYMNLELSLDPSGLPETSQSQDWFDPIFGLKAVIPFADHWHLAINGDIGGFGVESDFTWSSTGVVGYDFTAFGHPASVLFGYRVMSWDYENGSGDDKFVWDLRQQGVIFGFQLLF